PHHLGIRSCITPCSPLKLLPLVCRQGDLERADTTSGHGVPPHGMTQRRPRPLAAPLSNHINVVPRWTTKTMRRPKTIPLVPVDDGCDHCCGGIITAMPAELPWTQRIPFGTTAWRLSIG